MIKKICSFMLKDITNALRDNIVVYGALFPILLAVIMTFFIPSVQSMKVTVAVEQNVGQRVIEGLKEYANVEIYENRSFVQKRVEKNDDIAGIVKEKDEYVILLEGNEGSEAGEIAEILMDMILSDRPKMNIEHLSLGKTNSKMREISGALLLLTSILIGGYIVGFNIVNEKETKAVHAISLTPLKTGEFILSHMIICLISSIVLSLLSSFILARNTINYGLVIASIIATSGIGMILGFIIGALADNLISAIAIVKFEMLIFIGIPIASIFAPQNFQWLFYIFPNYWAFQSYLNIFNGNNQPIGFALSSLFALILSIIIMIYIAFVLKRKLKLR